MIIGNGLVAQGFSLYKDDKKVLIFASGVSNSTTKNPDHFNREALLLTDALSSNHDKIVVYISTCSIYDTSLQGSLYIQHKLKMEQLIKNYAQAFLIFRVPNLIGFTNNPNTILNYFYQHIQTGEHFTLWKNAGRNIIDMEDMAAIADYFIQKKNHPAQIINIANQYTYRVIDIVQILEKILNKKGNYTLIDMGDTPVIDISESIEAANMLGINFDENYLERTIRKYLTP